MSENQNVQFQTFEDAEHYVDTVRGLYRDEAARYKGQRNEDQQLIAEYTSDEARSIVDGTMAGILAVSSFGAETLPPNYETEVTKAGFTWKDFRGEFERLLVGFGVLTNRLQTKGYPVESYAEMGESDRMKAASVLLSDFLSHNALRFGVDTTGLTMAEDRSRHTEDGGIERITHVFDTDKAKNEREIEQNMKARRYTVEGSAHVAGKMSPDEYKKLRREYPEKDKDKFDQAVSYLTNARKEFENQE